MCTPGSMMIRVRSAHHYCLYSLRSSSSLLLFLLHFKLSSLLTLLSLPTISSTHLIHYLCLSISTLQPTNHLDHASVAWLTQYLQSQMEVTCLIVSHDTLFLDNVVTDIIHYETVRLSFNLLDFVFIIDYLALPGLIDLLLQGYNHSYLHITFNYHDL